MSVGYYADGKIEVLREKQVPLPLYLSQIPYGLAWNRTQTDD